MKKKLFPFLVLLLALSSCKKEITADPNAANFEFTLAGKSYGWNYNITDTILQKGAWVTRDFNPNTNQLIYSLELWDNADKMWGEFSLNTQVLAPGTYNITTTVSDPYVNGVFEFKGEKYAAYSGDLISVTITQTDGKRASGYFSAVMHDMRRSDKEIRIYNGNFSNIIVKQ